MLFQPQRFRDDRGEFIETWRAEWLPEAPRFVQHNLARRVGGSLVGLHYHRHQADYWVLVEGQMRVGLADLRRTAPTFRSSDAFDLAVGDALYIPRGVAHGFAALTAITMTYAVDQYYDPADELGVAWDDPEFAIDWGLNSPTLSDRDRANPTLKQIKPSELPS